MTEQAPAADRVSFVTIDEGREGQRLDNFLMVHLKGVPKSRIYRIIRAGEVRVNKKRAKPTTRLVAGDLVRVPPVRTRQSSAPAALGNAFADRLTRALVYEDDGLFIFNKPAGLAVHGGSGVSLGLIEALRALYPDEKQLELVHRLDRDTSGLIMVARKRSRLRQLQTQMQQGVIEKRYWLLCQGFKGSERRIDAPLLKIHVGSERMVRVSREGKPSATRFRLLERFARAQWVEAILETGRTHQIRVHSQFGGFPLLGDDKYGNASGEALLAAMGSRRLCLHAHTLILPDNSNPKKTMTVTAPLDEAFESLLTQLRSET